MSGLRKTISFIIAMTLVIGLICSVAYVPVNAVDASSNVAIFRLYNPNSGEHFYTSSQVERDSLIMSGWNGEGYAWMSPAYSSMPVYRLYNPNTGDHHYTINGVERDMLVANGWNNEEIGWYSSEMTAVPVYRQYNPNALGAGSHNYTTSAGEASSLISIGWQDEGIGWYGVNVAFPPYPIEPEKHYGPFTESQINVIKQSLGVPLTANVVVTVSNPWYWDGAGIWLGHVGFTDGSHTAGADCDSTTGEICRSILPWDYY